MQCPACQASNPEGRLFCRKCAALIGDRCQMCGFVNRLDDRYCGGCGKERAPAAPDETPAQELREAREAWRPAEAERRQITVMFCDLVGSTALSEQLDPEDMRDLFQAYREACARVVGRYEGWIAQFRGDGIMVYFGYPTAHEDDATRAVLAALEIVPAVRGIHNQWYAAGGLQLDVRIGIDTGLVVVGDLPTGAGGEHMAAVGDAPNVAARVQNYAEPGAVLITGNVMRLVAGLFVADDLGRHMMRNVREPVRLYRVRHASENITRFEAAASLTPFVDRESELALILDRWERSRAGDGQVVLVSGEPGIGKSRLIQVVHEQIGAQQHAWLRCQCSPYFGQSALYPVIVGLRRAVGILPEDTPEHKLTKLEEFISESGGAVDEAVPLLAALLSVPFEHRYRSPTLAPERKMELTLRAIIQVVENLAARRPLVLSVEDVHWIDPTSSHLLDRLMAGLPATAILLLVTFRPEFAPPWSAPQSTVHLTLGRLGQSLSARFIEHVTGGKQLPDDLAAQLVARSEGNPLFVEELTKAVLESGFVEEKDDRFVLVGPLQSLGIPVTLQESLLARLDRLAPIKEVAQSAAAIGRDFSYDLLAEIVRLTHDQLQEALDRLMAAGLISRLPGPPPVIYSFKHALVRDAAYDSILHRRRHALHGRIAEALRVHFAATIEQHPELLALHLTHASLHDEAIEAWLRAGLRAIERSATLEAVAHLRKGLELLVHLPDGPTMRKQEVRLQTALGAALRATQGFAAPAVVEVFERARSLCADLDDEELLLDVLPGLQSYYHVHGQLREARELGGQLIALASGRPEEPHRLLDARRRMGWSLLWLGELGEAGDYLEGALALYDPKDHQLHIRLYGDHPGVFSHCNLAWVRWAQGRTSEADRHSDAGLGLAEKVDHVLSLIYGMCVIGALYAARRDAAAARALAAKAIPFVEDKGFPYWTAWAHIVHGWALTQLGAPDEGLVELGQGIDDYVATGGELVRPYALGLLADARSVLGQHDGAIIALDEALGRAGDKSIGFYQPELLRLKGCSLLALGADVDESFGCLRQAVALAADQGAYSLELRAATTLARALLDQRARAEAREVIAATRARCPDPRNTPELQAADAVIADLGPD